MTKSPFIVYILPIILSVSLGTLVMAEALNDPERELSMWQFDSTQSITKQGENLTIIGLDRTYSISDSIQFEIKVNDSDFDCGDLYITIFEGDQVITQSGFMKQCFEQQNQKIPLGNKYSEIITVSGEYRILIEIFDQNYNDSLSYVANITVK
ncbi:MAG: hypothetical protein QF559_02670 [Candidatus Nitrosopelagicus sp.]|jgi:hypothetical protein|nr:hypothetical protein [Candidatus Nitrosopelagicus sp.]